MPFRSIRSVIAAWLIVLLGVLHTGLPSHSHELDPSGIVTGDVLRADHHSHGVALVEQTELIQPPPLQHPALPAAAKREAFPAPVRSLTAEHTPLITPSGRAPPPWHAPRAPPEIS
jgi:hypothetical protein